MVSLSIRTWRTWNWLQTSKRVWLSFRFQR